MGTLEELMQQLQSGVNPFAPNDQDRKDALTRALFSFGAGMLSSPSRGKGFMGALGSAGPGAFMGMNAYQDALSDASNKKKEALQMRMNLAGLIRQEKAQKREDARLNALEVAQKAAQIPGTPAVMEPGERGYMEEVAPAKAGGFDPKVFLDTYAATPGADPLQALELTAKLAKLGGWRKIGEAPGGGDLYIGPDGEPKVVGKSDGKWTPFKTDANGVWLVKDNGDMKYVHDTAAKVKVTAYGGAGGAVTEGLDEQTAKYVYGDQGPMAQMNAAQAQNANLKSMLPLVNKTGFFAPESKTAASLVAAVGLGGPQAKIAAASLEAFQAQSMKLVLDEQAKQKGPQTDKDFLRIQDSMPKLRNSPLGNEWIIRVRIAQNNRLMKQNEFMADLMLGDKANGRPPVNALAAQREWIRLHGHESIFDDPILKGFSIDGREASGSIGGGVTVGRRID